jgi:hypothetical protein
MQSYSDGVNVVINTFYLGFQPFFARQAAKRRWNSHHVSDAELVPFLVQTSSKRSFIMAKPFPVCSISIFLVEWLSIRPR